MARSSLRGGVANTAFSREQGSRAEDDCGGIVNGSDAATPKKPLFQGSTRPFRDNADRQRIGGAVGVKRRIV
jgi:hypothetical protein